MQLRTKIAASAAAASAVVLALTLNYLKDDGQITGPRTTVSAQAPVIRPITGDDRALEAGKSARINAFFASLENDPATAPMYLAIREEFPERYAEIKDTVRREMASPNPPADPQQRIIQMTRESLDGFAALIRQSSDESLRKVAAAQFGLLTALSTRDPEACARYAAQGGEIVMPDSPQVTQAIASLAVTQIHAAGDAAKSPQKREAPAPAVYAQLVQSMKNDGVSDLQISLLADGKLGTLLPDEQCGVARSMYHSALGMPPKDAGTLLAAIIKN